MATKNCLFAILTLLYALITCSLQQQTTTVHVETTSNEPIMSAIKDSYTSLVSTSNAYNDFLTIYGRMATLEIADIDDITRNLLEKFKCKSHGTDCNNVSL